MGEDTEEEEDTEDDEPEPLDGWLGADDPALPELWDDELGPDEDDCGDFDPGGRSRSMNFHSIF